jgi:hypothetical protein
MRKTAKRLPDAILNITIVSFKKLKVLTGFEGITAQAANFSREHR